MPRRKRVLKRPTIVQDSTYNSILVSRLINRVMWDGKKTIAAGIVVNAIKEASDELQVSPLDLIETAVKNTTPTIEVKSVRVGGANYQVPIQPYEARALRLSLTWIVNSARSIKGKPMQSKLKTILVQSYNNEGPAVTKKETVHQTAAGNRAFAHLAMRVGRKK